MARTCGLVSTYNAGCRCALCTRANREWQRRVKEKLARKPYWEVPHGTTNGYNNYGCRCEKCRAVHNAALKRQREARRALPFEEKPHGLKGYQSYGCRCEKCAEAGKAYQVERRRLAKERAAG